MKKYLSKNSATINMAKQYLMNWSFYTFHRFMTNQVVSLDGVATIVGSNFPEFLRFRRSPVDTWVARRALDSMSSVGLSLSRVLFSYSCLYS